MKKIYLFAVAVFMSHLVIAQSSKQVQWAYTAKKVADKTYEVHMTATINGDYHIYAYYACGDGPVATSFNFVKTPLLLLDGNVKESGKLIKKFETAWIHDVKYYEKTVDFVQIVRAKSGAKSNLAGKVEFMVCNDKQCLPPSEVDIKVSVGG